MTRFYARAISRDFESVLYSDISYLDFDAALQQAIELTPNKTRQISLTAYVTTGESHPSISLTPLQMQTLIDLDCSFDLDIIMVSKSSPKESNERWDSWDDMRHVVPEPPPSGRPYMDD